MLAHSNVSPAQPIGSAACRWAWIICGSEREGQGPHACVSRGKSLTRWRSARETHLDALGEAQAALVALVEPGKHSTRGSAPRSPTHDNGHSRPTDAATHLLKISSNFAGMNLPSESYTPVSEPCLERCPFLRKMRKKGSGRNPGAVNHEKKKWMTLRVVDGSVSTRVRPKREREDDARHGKRAPEERVPHLAEPAPRVERPQDVVAVLYAPRHESRASACWQVKGRRCADLVKEGDVLAQDGLVLVQLGIPSRRRAVRVFWRCGDIGAGHPCE